MTNPATDFVASSACPAYSARARDAVHRFALPGMGFRSVHGLLGIFIKNYEEVPWGDSLERFYLALATFLKMSVRPCDLPKRMPRKARPRTDRGSALGAPCERQRSRNDLPGATCAQPELAPSAHAGYPPRLAFPPAIIIPIGQRPRRHRAPPRRKRMLRDAARLPLL